ncbi:hypothetical protein RIF29_24299 [Crotalaria pallida]|uniref:Uncharacterized protein n=1 Tax=Crotalaria pallida TaxID=3830 RepID=A0AAN9EK41_CROPI
MLLHRATGRRFKNLLPSNFKLLLGVPFPQNCHHQNMSDHYVLLQSGAELQSSIICLKRRSRINEKMKALQNLIPNSNKDSDNKSTKEKKKKGLGKLKHGETNSFIPLFREPSSLEKIFGDFEREQRILTVRPPTPPPEKPKTPPFVPPPPRVASPRASSPRPPSPRAASPRAPSPRPTSPKAASSRIVHHHKEVVNRPEPTLRNQHASATKIQAAFRGYMARRSFRALKGLVRLQVVVRGHNAKRQTVNAMKHMQLLVRV